MMMEEAQQNLPTSGFQAKPAEPELQMNSQGERIEAPAQKEAAPSQYITSDPLGDVISLGDTALAMDADALYPPTDDTGMEHKIISCGHVLKSTHDLARWSEKTGARRVNGQESIDSVSDLAINLEPNLSNRGNNRRANNNSNNADPSRDIRGLFNEGGNARRGNRRGGQQKWQAVEGEKSEVINCWPVLKSTHDQAQLSEKRGRAAVNKAGASDALDEVATNQQAQGTATTQQGGTSQILHSWPVLKSTHDQARLSEKRGPNAVNQSGASEVLEEVAQSQGRQAGGMGGSSLQSGLDTQGGSHVQMDTNQ